MASIIIRDLDEGLKQRLRLHAARRGNSMEEAAREILKQALAVEPRRPANLAEAIRRRFARIGGLDLKLPPREAMRAPPHIGRGRKR